MVVVPVHRARASLVGAARSRVRSAHQRTAAPVQELRTAASGERERRWIAGSERRWANVNSCTTRQGRPGSSHMRIASRRSGSASSSTVVLRAAWCVPALTG